MFPRKLAVPFTAIKSFFDPSVQFGLQFETIEVEQDVEHDNADTPPEKSATARSTESKSSVVTPIPRRPKRKKTEKPGDDGPPDDKPSGEVVRLDRFRKK